MERKITKAEAEEFDRVFAPPTEEEFYTMMSKYAEEMGSVCQKTIIPDVKRKDWRLCREIGGDELYEKFNEDWFISANGDLMGWGCYLISAERLQESDWLIHLMTKRQFDANTFIPAYREACFRAGVQNVTMKMFY